MTKVRACYERVAGAQPVAEKYRERNNNAYVPGLRLRSAVTTQRTTNPAAEGQRGPAEGSGGGRLPQRHSSRGRVVRSRRRQKAQPCRSRHETAGHSRSRECRRGGGGRPG